MLGFLVLSVLLAFVREEAILVDEEYLYPDEFDDFELEGEQNIAVNITSVDHDENRWDSEDGVADDLYLRHRVKYRSRILDERSPLDTAEDLIMQEAQMSEEQLQELAQARVKLKYDVYGKEDEDFANKKPVFDDEDTDPTAQDFDFPEVPKELEDNAVDEDEDEDEDEDNELEGDEGLKQYGGKDDEDDDEEREIDFEVDEDIEGDKGFKVEDYEEDDEEIGSTGLKFASNKVRDEQDIDEEELLNSVDGDDDDDDDK